MSVSLLLLSFQCSNLAAEAAYRALQGEMGDLDQPVSIVLADQLVPVMLRTARPQKFTKCPDEICMRMQEGHEEWDDAGTYNVNVLKST